MSSDTNLRNSSNILGEVEARELNEVRILQKLVLWLFLSLHCRASDTQCDILRQTFKKYFIIYLIT